MTDPNVTPPVEPTPRTEVHHTTINNPAPARSGGGWIGFLVGGLVVVVLIIAFVVFSNGGMSPGKDTNVDINVDLPDAPKMPDLPDVPAVEPPSVPGPEPVAEN
ncbi:hypothetical protein [Brevundimonas sp.]|uniref:hypothetical protein n=1 Tax=Brevundimonas sp. TaxID=1871086 RepID=UPI0035699C6C